MKTAAITGANSGMGLATATALAKQGYQVLLLCRSEQRGLAAVKHVKKQAQSDLVEYISCDLASLASIRECSQNIHKACSKLDILINNAGIVTTKHQTTSDGFEMMMGVNHFGHFLLTNLLLDLIKAAPSGRIVVLSSGAYKFDKLDLENLQAEKSFSVWKGYGRGKLANILFTHELADRLADSNVIVNAVHPGAVSTNLGVNRNSGFGKGIHKLLRPFFQTPDEGADTALYLALSPEIQVSGGYFYKRKQQRLKGQANDKLLAQRLWKISEKAVGISV